jgi:hypothetical protein
VAARKERERRAALEALAGEAIEDGAAEYNPFLEDGSGRTDDETERLALAATIAGGDGGGDGEDGDFNPFLGEADRSADPQETVQPEINPFLEDSEESSGEEESGS